MVEFDHFFLLFLFIFFPYFHPLKYQIYKNIHYECKGEATDGHKKMTFAEVHCRDDCRYKQTAEEYSLPVAEIVFYKFWEVQFFISFLIEDCQSYDCVLSF